MSLRHALLGLLADRPGSGYDLMKRFGTSLSNVWPATQSQVYGELARLSASGHAEVSAEGPRGRKEYALTDEGLAELRRWLTAPQTEVPQRSEMLLRVFFLGLLTPGQATDYLAGRAEKAAERHGALKELKAATDWDEGMLSVYGRLALEYGVRLRSMEEEWARWAADEVKAAGARAEAGPGEDESAVDGSGGDGPGNNRQGNGSSGRRKPGGNSRAKS